LGEIEGGVPVALWDIQTIQLPSHPLEVPLKFSVLWCKLYKFRPMPPGSRRAKTRKKVKKPRTDHKLPGNPLDFEDETLFY